MADHDLAMPLLSSQPSDHPRFIVEVREDDDVGPSGNGIDRHSNEEDGGDSRSDSSRNPYAFLGSDRFDVPPQSTVNPFRNHTAIGGAYEWVKILICLPIAALRLVLFGICLAVGYLATKLAIEGWKDKQNPMPKWRCRLMWITRFCARCVLFSFGYHWISRKGKPAPRETAPIVVSNHVSYIEPIFYFYELFPTIVASESHDSLPFVGTIIRAMQVIYVNRFSPSSRKFAVNEIKRKASCDRFPRVLLFPEGTTTNGRVLISFQLGAFIPGYPIQPVVVRYPHVHFDQSWGLMSLTKLMFRMFTQFHNFMEIEYLPVVSPRDHEKESAVHFAERTGQALATALNVVQTSHSYGDLMLLMKAAESKQAEPSAYMVEMAGMELLHHVSSLEAVDFLDKFLSMNPNPSVLVLHEGRDLNTYKCLIASQLMHFYSSHEKACNSGHVKYHEFVKVLRLKTCTLSEEIFSFIDVEKSGAITFKQFLFGSTNVMNQPLFRQACELAFAKCAVRGNDCISEQELGESIRFAIPELTQDEGHELFVLFDTNSDGKISKDEFLSCLRKNPLLIALFSPCLLQKDLSDDSNRLREDIM